AEGEFFRPFARLHPSGRFPTISLLFMGIASALACLVSLDNLIAVLIVVQIMFQYTAQCFAVIALRRRQPVAMPGQFRMPAYPLPVIITLAGWLYIVGTSKLVHIAAGIAMIGLGTAIFLIVARTRKYWPF